jgi:hypothetical protein
MKTARFQGAKTSCLALACATVLTASADAATLALLQNGTHVVWVDSEQKKVVGSVALAGGASLVAFDVRPADGRLYGVTPEGAIVVVDPKTGAWDKVSQLSEMLPPGVAVSVDFNPVADRMRILTSTGLSLRVNVQDGKATVDGALRFADTDANAGATPRVVAAGYTNSVAGAKETTLYDVEMSRGVLVRQAPPNDGILAAIGALGLHDDGPVAFDIWSDGAGANAGWLLSGGRLHRVDLMTGATSMPVEIKGLSGRIIDLAILPAK